MNFGESGGFLSETDNRERSENVLIKLNTAEKAQVFSEFCAQHFAEEIDVRQGRYVVNAKSVLGVFSLNLLEPIEVVIFTTNRESEQTLRTFLEEEGVMI